MKVYELAKELNKKALELIDEVKDLNLEIKNHMAALSPEQVDKIRTFFEEKTKPKAPKKKIVRKAKTSKTSATKRRVITRTRKVQSDEDVIEDLAAKPEEIALSQNASENAADKVENVDVAGEVQANAEVSDVDGSGAEDANVAEAKENVEPIDAKAVEQEQPEEGSSEKTEKPSFLKKVFSNILGEKEDDVSEKSPAENVEAVEAQSAEEAPVAKVEKEVAKSEEAQDEVKEEKSRYSFIKATKADDISVETRRIVVEESVEELPEELTMEGTQKKFESDPEDVAHYTRTASDIMKEIEQEGSATNKKRGGGFKANLTAQSFRSTDYLRRERVYQNHRRKHGRGGPARGYTKSSGGLTKEMSSKKKVVEFDTSISVENLAHKMSLKVRDVARKLDALGVEAENMIGGFSEWMLDLDTVHIIANEFGYEVKDRTEKAENLISSGEDKFEEKARSAVVTIMGHVDHGKTSLLDLIRRARVASKEAGGITQHIGAYTVTVDEAVINLLAMKDKKAAKKKEAELKKKKKSSDQSKRLTFLDTPGHAAFSSMRSRGAQVTDIVVLVVAATDGVMPQTREAVEHARAAGVPVIVAVNKMDLPEANPDKVTQQLSEMNVVPEDWGGDNIFVQVSAKTGEGVDQLLESIQLQAELLELKARDEGPSEGIIIEANLDKGRGPVATVLMKKGTLNVGEYIVAGTSSGKVRALIDDKGQNIKFAGPSTPVAILGLSDVPKAGDSLNCVENESDAKRLIALRKEQLNQDGEDGTPKKMTLEELYARMNEGDVKELSLILTSDVQGSSEAIQGALEKLPQKQVKLKILSNGVGGISENDVLLAAASQAIILGFSVRPDAKAKSASDNKGVQIKTYDVIYNLIDDVKKSMEGLLDPIENEVVHGQAEVRNVFNLSKVGTIAGCFVTQGKIKRNFQVRLIRDGVVVYTGELGGLKRFKDDVKEVKEGYECGMSVSGYNDLKEGDVIEAFEVEHLAPSLDGDSSARENRV